MYEIISEIAGRLFVIPGAVQSSVDLDEKSSCYPQIQNPYPVECFPAKDEEMPALGW